MKVRSWAARAAAGFLSRLLLSTLLVIAIVAAQAGAARAATAGPDRLGAHLAAGEFAPALKLAGQTADREQRDGMLARIAQAQARAGDRLAAIRTSGAIDDDRARTIAINEFKQPRGAEGGAQADFDSLIELITTTIAPTTWDEVGGPGSVKEFQGGVYIDAEGVLQPLLQVDRSGSLIGLRTAAIDRGVNSQVRKAAPLRKISLPRLERSVQLALARGEQPTEEMQLLAGLDRVKYVLIYPDTGDLVIAGPAGDWRRDAEGRLVASDSGRPKLQLDDLVVILRHMCGARDARFGCSITPTKENLAKTQAFLAESSKSPLKPGQRDAWLKQLRATLGRQTIDVEGIDPRTRVAQVLVEADYRMKLVGMGLEEGTLGVTSYLNLINLKRGEQPPAMDVLRWWFTMNYDTVVATPERQGYELRGQGVQVLSENELLTKLGERVHTGGSEPLNHEFAHSFTQNFAALAVKYPIYAELQNMFDLALVGALVKTENLAEQVDWRMTCFGDPAQCSVALLAVPREVETIVNHRVINQTTILAGVSGGVSVNPWRFVEPKAIATDTYGKLKAERVAGSPKNVPRDVWWWD